MEHLKNKPKILSLDRKAIVQILNEKNPFYPGDNAFYTLNNGGRVFEVNIDYDGPTEGQLNINVGLIVDSGQNDFKIKKLFSIKNVDALYVGSGSYDDPKDLDLSNTGNTCLIVKGHTAISLCNRWIHKFSLFKDDPIVKYFSTVNNSGVPYGYVETKHGYFFIPGMNCVNDLMYMPKKYATEEVQSNLECIDERRIGKDAMKHLVKVKCSEKYFKE